MSDKLIVINDLSHYKPIPKEKARRLIGVIANGAVFSGIFLIIRAIFIMPIFIFTNERRSFIELYVLKYAFSSPSYEKIWDSFRGAFSIIFDNSDFLMKYMIISFILLSIILSSLMKSPIGILISFITTVISPYVIRNIILPAISFIYVPISFISLFIDNLIPVVNIVLVWASLGFLFGVTKGLKGKVGKSRVLLCLVLIGLFIVSKYSFEIEGAVQMSSLF